MNWPTCCSRILLVALVLCHGWVQSEPGKREAKVTVSGVEFEPLAQVGDSTLPFRGGTLCRHKTFKVYTAALYVAPEHQLAEKILGPVPKRLLLHYHRDISRDDFIEVSEKTIAKNPGLDYKQLRPRLQRLYTMFQDVREGDRYWLDHIPGKHTELFLNGRSLGRIEGDDFAKAYFGIWLSDHSISEKYRRRIIGKVGLLPKERHEDSEKYLKNAVARIGVVAAFQFEKNNRRDLPTHPSRRRTSKHNGRNQVPAITYMVL